MQLSELTGDAAVFADVLKDVLKNRARAKELQDEAKSIIADVNETFMRINEVCGVDSVSNDVGSIFLMNTGGKETFNKDKAKDLLIKKGVDSSLVMEVFKKATTKGKENVSVSFRLTTEKEE